MQRQYGRSRRHGRRVQLTAPNSSESIVSSRIAWSASATASSVSRRSGLRRRRLRPRLQPLREGLLKGCKGRTAGVSSAHGSQKPGRGWRMTLPAKLAHTLAARRRKQPKLRRRAAVMARRDRPRSRNLPPGRRHRCLTVKPMEGRQKFRMRQSQRYVAFQDACRQAR